MDIAEFLTARLDEDEAAAKAAGSAPWVADIPRSVHVSFKARAENKHAFRGQGYIAGVENAGAQTHIARHDPARVLREVAAKRAIIEAHGLHPDPCDAHDPATMKSEPCEVLVQLATVHSDHPDYQQEWAL